MCVVLYLEKFINTQYLAVYYKKRKKDLTYYFNKDLTYYNFILYNIYKVKKGSCNFP